MDRLKCRMVGIEAWGSLQGIMTDFLRPVICTQVLQTRSVVQIWVGRLGRLDPAGTPSTKKKIVRAKRRKKYSRKALAVK
jgi:hypothetical protein